MPTSGSAPARRTGECAGQRAGAPGKAGWRRRFLGRVRERAHEKDEGGRKASPAARGLSSCRREVAPNNRPLFRGSRDADAVSSFAWLPSGTVPIAAEQRKSDTAAKTSVAAAAFAARNQDGPKERRAELWWGRPPKRENDTPPASLRTGSETGIPRAGVGQVVPSFLAVPAPVLIRPRRGRARPSALAPPPETATGTSRQRRPVSPPASGRPWPEMC